MFYYLISWGEKSSRFQGESLEGRERANRGFRGGGRAEGWIKAGWLELSVSSRSCLSSSILAALTDSLPSRTACKPRWFIFLTCTDTGSTAGSRQACGGGRGEESLKPSLNPQMDRLWGPAKYWFPLFCFASKISSYEQQEQCQPQTSSESQLCLNKAAHLLASSIWPPLLSHVDERTLPLIQI